jgi:hypothetical protein
VEACVEEPLTEKQRQVVAVLEVAHIGARWREVVLA